MNRAIRVLGLLLVLAAGVSWASSPDDKSSWTGWISDSHCGAKGMSAGHKSCAETCIKTKSASWVFVDSKDSKVYPIKNQTAVAADKDLGHTVTVTGHVNNDGTISVDSVSEAKM